MAKYDVNLLEETLKIKVRDDYFPKFKMGQIGKIDFVISKTKEIDTDLFINLEFFDQFNQNFLWAEAKKGVNHDIYESFIQLILTIGKERTFEKHLPPMFLGAFDAEKIAFISYDVIAPVFFQNDFNWNVTPSNHDTKEFKQLFDLVKDELAKNAFMFNYETQESELGVFIEQNFKFKKFGTYKIEITKNNFTSIYFKWLNLVKPTINIDWSIVKKKGLIDSDFFLADLFSDENHTIKDSLYGLLKETHYEFSKKVDEFGLENWSKASFNDNQEAHRLFWQIYKRPPKKEFWDYIIDRRGLLVPQDVRERKGSYFTPQIWVEKSQEYLSKALGENWQDEYYIWDCCAGTGNLLNGLTNKYNIWASTIDQADVDVMKDRIKNGANLLENHVFKFDFLNDSFDALPDGLKNIINSEEKRKKLVIYINPPYAEAATKRTITGTGENKTDVSVSTTAYEKFKNRIGLAGRELFALFLIRICSEIPGCIIGNFSKLKLLLAPTFKKFRKQFTYRLNSIFLVEANTFDNVKGIFPIGFHVWQYDKHFTFSHIVADIYDRHGELISKKTLQNYENFASINDWLISTRKRKSEFDLGFMSAKGCDFQNQNFVFIINNKNQLPHPRGTIITDSNLLECSIYFAARKVIVPKWTDDRDQYIAPSDKLNNDNIFKSNCLVYTLFSQANNIKSSEGINHWIPFKESEIDTRDVIESHFMSDYIKNIKFSKTAQDVLDSARNLYSYYHSKSDSNPNASYYDIREYFQGRNDKGNLNASSKDETYNQLISDLKEKHKLLSREIEPKIYEYGFLIR